jgi:hypothetical protein
VQLRVLAMTCPQHQSGRRMLYIISQRSMRSGHGDGTRPQFQRRQFEADCAEPFCRRRIQPKALRRRSTSLLRLRAPSPAPAPPLSSLSARAAAATATIPTIYSISCSCSRLICGHTLRPERLLIEADRFSCLCLCFRVLLGGPTHCV